MLSPSEPSRRRDASILEAVTIRRAYADDAPELAQLAALDSADAPPPAPLLVAEVEGRIRVALSLSADTVIADPFHPSAALIDLLRARAAMPSRGRWRRAPLARLRFA